MRHFAADKISALVLLLSLAIVGCGSTSDEGRLPRHALRRLGTLDLVSNNGGATLLQFSPDGRYLATAGFGLLGTYPGGVEIWELESGKNVTPRKLRGHDATGFCWAPDGLRFVTSNNNAPAMTDNSVLLNGLYLWQVGDNNFQQIGVSKGPFHFVMWSPRGDSIAVAMRGTKEVCIIDLEGQVLKHFPLAVERSLPSTRVMDFNRDGSELAVVSGLGVRIHNVQSGEVLEEIPVEADCSIHAIRYLPRRRLVAACSDRGVHLVPLKGAEDSARILSNQLTLELAVSKDGNWLAARGYSELNIWDLKTGDLSLSQMAEGGCWGLDFAPHEPELALGASRIVFLKTGTWGLVRNADDHHHHLRAGIVDGDRIWTGEFGATFREWDYKQGTAIRTLLRPKGIAFSMAKISAEQLAVAGGVPEIDIWDLTTGKTLFQLPGHSVATHLVGYSAKHRRLVSVGREGEARIWNLETKTLQQEISPVKSEAESSFGNLVVAPDGESFICSRQSSLELEAFSLPCGTPLWTLPGKKLQTMFSPIAFTPDSLRVASVAEVIGTKTKGGVREVVSYGIRISDVKTGAEVSRLNCNSGYMQSIAISPDGRIAAIFAEKLKTPGSLDDISKEIQIWSLQKPAQLAALPIKGGSFQSLVFSSDSKNLISLSSDTTALVWDLKGLGG